MKKILVSLITITLIVSGSNNLIACNNQNIENNKLIQPNFIAQQPPKNSNWKLIPKINNILMPPIEIAHTNNNKYYVKEDHRTYFVVYGNDILKWESVNTTAKGINNKWSTCNDCIIYYWNGAGYPKIPKINKNNGEITDWNEK